MWGSIIGDIVGSIYEGDEHNKIRTYKDRMEVLDRNYSLFTNECEFTDDTILTASIADAILNKRGYEEVLREYGNYYVDKKNKVWGNAFGKNYIKWLHNEHEGNSIGNGSAMRVSPIGYYYSSRNDILEQSKLSAIPSHNSEEAINGAQAIAMSIFLAKLKVSKSYIKDAIRDYFKYDLNFNLEDLQHTYTFKSTCSNSVPQAIYLFLEADSFEDGIRKSLSIGGDTDTIACMTGGILEAYYGVPECFKREAIKYLDDKIKVVIDEFYSNTRVSQKVKKTSWRY